MRQLGKEMDIQKFYPNELRIAAIDQSEKEIYHLKYIPIQKAASVRNVGVSLHTNMAHTKEKYRLSPF